MAEQRNTLTYRDAGVDIDAGNSLVERIKPAAAATDRGRRDGRARRLRRALRPEGRRLPRSDPGRDDRRRRHQAQDRHRMRRAQHDRHRPRRDVRERPRRAGRRAAPLPRLFRLRRARRRGGRRRDRGHRRGLPHGRRGARRRRDGGDAGALRQGRLRPRRLRRRRGRARSDPAARRHRRPATSCSASPRPAFIRTASRWSAAIAEMAGLAMVRSGAVRAGDEPRRSAARRRRASMCAPASPRSARPAR